MASVFDIAQRTREPELMDDPGLEERRHQGALRGLARINRWSCSAASLWRALRAGLHGGTGAARVLDVATGAGDIPIGLWRYARRRGWRLEIDGCDTSTRALDYARARAAARGSRVRFFQLDVLRDELPTGYDAVISSLFLHHLEDEQAVSVLRKMATSARTLVLVNDLRRDWLGFALAWCGSRTLTRSDVVHIDAPRSVQAAFTSAELHALAEGAGLGGATVRRCWPRRLLLVWRRPLT
jgi:SAM-dependent methyltransferase